MSIVIIENENNEKEWVKMEKANNWYIVYHYVNNNVQRKCMIDDFLTAVEYLKEWKTYFE